jgi:cysteine desulfurase/selenocysteine lyase
MNTRSPAGQGLGAAELPAEAQGGLAQLPRQGEVVPTPSAAGTTPGVALAAARVPGSPTVPDMDPMALARVVSQVANELFAAPFMVPAEAPAMANDAAVPSMGQPPVGAVAHVPPVAPATEVGSPPASPAGSPFSVPLDFSSLEEDHAKALGFGGGPVLDWPNLRLIDPQVQAELPRTPLDTGVPASPPEGGTQVDRIPSAHALEISPLYDESIPNLGSNGFDPYLLKREFPILRERVRGRELVWLDNAATTQKPRAVIDRLTRFYEHENSNIHRAAHTLAARATDAYEAARESVRRFIRAGSAREVIFVRGTTEGINLVAQSWGRANVGDGDEIVVSALEHHANIVPWQMLCAERGAKLRVAPVDDRGQILLGEYERLVGDRTKLVAFTHVSNALGTITPAREMIEIAHRRGARVLLDGAQSVSHMPVDVQTLGCDFFVFSGHKVFGPTGIGAVFGRSELLDAMPPWQGGVNMIQDVTFERTTYQAAPARFEAGTGNIADAVGLGAALDWLTRVGIQNVERYEHELLEYGTERLRTVPGLRMIGTAPHKAGVLSFVLEGQKTEEVGGMLDQEGIAVRSGHHCAQPILRRLGLEATVRASLAPYNTFEDLDRLCEALHRIQSGHHARP